MAGTIVHLAVAEKLWQRMTEKKIKYIFAPELSPCEENFIAGNICPDGIMARKGYQREMKLHTHFRDGIPDGSFDKPGMVPLFEKRMTEFWQEHLSDEKERPGLYLGYITHMMTDERFILEERPKFFREIARLGLTKWDRETYVYFNEETDLVDFWLLRNHPELQNARKSLEMVKPYSIRDMITEEELTDSREWILEHFFCEEHPDKMPRFLQCESMDTFIQRITEEILDRLEKEKYVMKDSES